ncbi:MAG: FKBP-type peptidyl-prolyl cis-trans isomerase [Chloroflexi bacterium]|nr:FKBP-type peptidyl-prolyl cis-trans isomerase [Chloroflexota bacterium]
MKSVKSKRRLVAIGIFTLALIWLTACQAAGRNPDDLEIPVIQATADLSLCQNDRYPQDAPAFEDVSSEQLVARASGIRVFDRQTGDGPVPTIQDLVTVRYTGWLTDGCIFDSTFTRNQDAQLLLVSLIPGWREAILTMATGTIRRVEIPSDLAYDDLGSPPTIPPNATLTFDIELVNVLTPAVAQMTATAVAASFTPTPEGSAGVLDCNAGYPDTAPKFGDVSGNQLVIQESGISVFDIAVGDGNSPGPDDTVNVHYTGWLTDGCVFDTSYSRGQVVSFPVGGVIPGFRDAILGMSVGGHRRVEIPPELGYGDAGAGTAIPPGATIIFDIILESIGDQ